MSDTEDDKKTKKPAKKTIPIEEFMKSKLWDKVRSRLKRIGKKRERVGELIYYTLSNITDVPLDILESLFSKLDPGSRTADVEEARKSNYNPADSFFWERICGFEGFCRNGRSAKTRMSQAILRQPLQAVKLVLGKYAEFAGFMSLDHIRKVICEMWHFELLVEPGSFGYFSKVTKHLALLDIKTIADLKQRDSIQALWERTKLIVSMSQRGGLHKTIDEFHLVKNLILAKAPNLVIWFALRLYPTQAQLLDEKRMVPLHHAAKENMSDVEENALHERVLDFQGAGHCCSMKDLLNKETSLVEILLDCWPEASHLQDDLNAFPLDYLLNLEYKRYSFNEWNDRCMVKLLNIAPEALNSKRNRVNHMFPFMAAAAIHDNNTVKARTKETERRMDLRKLNLCFKTLRADPSVVSEGIQESDHERYYRTKWKQAEAARHVVAESNTRGTTTTSDSSPATIGRHANRSNELEGQLAEAQKTIVALREEIKHLKQNQQLASDSNETTSQDGDVRVAKKRRRQEGK